ncbi:MAG: ABC transporter ATP-binding protein [Raineya sp.]
MLILENISLNYEKSIFQNVSFSCQKGELVCILGRNGAGKSSLIRCITGLEKKYSGNIFLEKRNIKTYQAKQLAQKIAVVLSTKVDAPYLGVYDAIALGRTPYLNWLGQVSSQDTEAIKQALEITETEQFADRFLHTLSDGERQRVMIARAIAQESPLIVLDEPTAFLDVYYRKQIMALLHKIAIEQKKCILLSTHEIDLALQYAHSFLLLNLERKNWFLKAEEGLSSQIYKFLGL